jgi:hypothetical protein
MVDQILGSGPPPGKASSTNGHVASVAPAPTCVDPLVCGITDLCPACQAAEQPPPTNRWDEARQQWEALYDGHHRLLRFPDARPWELPSTPSPEFLRLLAWAILSPDCTSLLGEVLAPLITRIAVAVVKEMLHAR